MNSITVSLEWAKKLRDAGWNQEVLFYWSIDSRSGNDVVRRRREKGNNKPLDPIAAPTAEEILRVLPSEAPHPDIEHTAYFLEIVRVERPTENWQVQYRERESWRLWDSPEPHSADSLANAAAAMYVYLAENNLLTKQPWKHSQSSS